MPRFFSKAEIITPDLVEIDFDITDGTNVDSSSHCAWCGDEPDEYGSHDICSFHAEQLLQQSAERAEARRRLRG